MAAMGIPPWLTGPRVPEQQRPRPIIRPTPSADVRGRAMGGGISGFRPTPTWNPERPSGVNPSQFPQTGSLNIPDQTGDYRNLWNRYESILNANPASYSAYSPERLSYQESPEAQASLNQLSELSRTGGLGEAEQASLRERGISPIRAVYANALRNLNRRQNIAGGYAPGLGASTARMAREQSEQAAQATTNVNANIAEAVQRGRLAAAPQYEAATGTRTAGINQIAAANAARQTEADQFNRQMELRTAEANRGGQTEALRGMTSLYGTTPALTESFSRQALSREGQQNDMSRYLIDAYSRGVR